MALLSYVTLTGEFLDGSGAPLAGSLAFTPSATVRAGGVPVLQPDVPVQAAIAGGQLQAAGGGAVKLLPTDTAGVTAEGLTGFWYWSVSGTIGGEAIEPWSFFLPSSSSSVDLWSLANTPAGGAAVSSVFGRTGAVTAQSGDYTAPQVGALAGASGVPSARLAPKVVALADAATIVVDASLGNDFRVTLGGNRAMAAPSNPADGQGVTFELVQDATGGRTVTWATGAGGYSFGSGSAPTLSTAAGAADLVAFRYSAAKGEWLALGSALGFL